MFRHFTVTETDAMSWLLDWEVFVRTAEGGSMAAAARYLDCSRTQISKKLAELERSLGVRLMERSTRSLRLTPSGEVFYQHALRVLGEIRETELAMERMVSVPRGVLRITTPVTFGRLHIAPLLDRFSVDYPEVHCELVLNDRLVKVDEEGFDLAIRLTDAPPENLVARKLATIKRVICASPAYLEKMGTPSHPGELVRHACFAYSHASTLSEWRLLGPRGIETFPVRGKFQINHVEAIQTAVLQHAGIAILPDYLCSEELARGNLRPILEDYEPLTSFGRYVFACYPATRVQLPKFKVFMEALGRRFEPLPPWERRST